MEQRKRNQGLLPPSRLFGWIELGQPLVRTTRRVEGLLTGDGLAGTHRCGRKGSFGVNRRTWKSATHSGETWKEERWKDARGGERRRVKFREKKGDLA